MTRETKIGLLVGLAFIIVIGILLSDHINSSADPAPAQASKIYDSLERSVSAPDARQPGQTVVVTPAHVLPRDPVPTEHDTSPPAGVSIIKIQPGGDPSTAKAPAPVSANQQPDEVQRATDEVDKPPLTSDPRFASSDTTPLTSGAAPDRLRQIARKNGEDVVAVGTPPVPVAMASPVGQSRGSALGPSKQVTAEQGDTVCKLAAKYLGGNTKSNREAIIRANPSMTPDGHLVITGRTYVIPATVAHDVEAAAPEDPAKTSRITPARSAPTLYTVKDNDSLWKIAAAQLGSGNRWTEIRDLNQHLLKGGAQLQVNMRLKLPERPVDERN